MEPISILKLATFSKSIAEFLGIIESLNQKIDNLSKAELDAGIRTLKQANSSENEKEPLLRDARNYFNKAISLEKNDRQLVALTGLCLCHSYLGDNVNMNNTFDEIQKFEFDMNVLDTYLLTIKKAEELIVENEQSKFQKYAYDFLRNGFLPGMIIGQIKDWRTSFKLKEIQKFDQLKIESIKFLESVINRN